MIKIKSYSQEEMTEEILNSLKYMLSESYYNSEMFQSLKRDLTLKPKYFRAFLAFKDNDIVGCVILKENFKESLQDVCRDFSHAHIKRFCVDKDYRGKGIGKMLLAELKRYAFEELELPVIFGETSESMACSFYGKQGALFHVPRIEKSNLRISPCDNVNFFKIFTTDCRFSNYRYDIKKGLVFAFCKDNKIENKLRNNDMLPYSEII